MQIIASSSKGNAYLLDNLLIEAGIPMRALKRGLKFKLPDACIVSHEHGDHAKSVMDLLVSSVPVFASAGTWRKLGIKHYRAFTIKAGNTYEIAGWDVTPIEAEHDAEEPLAFILEKDNRKILFATDTAVLHEEPEGCTEIYIEANYSEAILEDNIGAGVVPDARTQAILGHMSYEYCEDYLGRLNLNKCEKITLLHLSDDNSDVGEWIESLQERFGIPVYGGKGV